MCRKTCAARLFDPDTEHTRVPHRVLILGSNARGSVEGSHHGGRQVVTCVETRSQQGTSVFSRAVNFFAPDAVHLLVFYQVPGISLPTVINVMSNAKVFSQLCVCALLGKYSISLPAICFRAFDATVEGTRKLPLCSRLIRTREEFSLGEPSTKMFHVFLFLGCCLGCVSLVSGFEWLSFSRLLCISTHSHRLSNRMKSWFYSRPRKTTLCLLAGLLAWLLVLEFSSCASELFSLLCLHGGVIGPGERTLFDCRWR